MYCKRRLAFRTDAGHSSGYRRLVAIGSTILLAATLPACGQRNGVGEEATPGDTTPASAAASNSEPSDPAATRPSAPQPSQPTDPGPLLVLPSDLAGGGLSAEVRGRLVFRGACAYINTPWNREPRLDRIVWPRGTAWQEQSRAVILRNGDVLRDGDGFYAAGGFVSDRELALYLGDELAARAFECDEARGTHLVHDDLATWGDPPAAESDGAVAPLLVLPAEVKGELISLVQGRLVFGRTCVYLRISNNGRKELHRVVWPTGTTWREHPPAVVLPNGEVLKDGDSLNAAGGFVWDFALNRYVGDDLGTRGRRECADAEGTAVLNSDPTTWPD